MSVNRASQTRYGEHTAPYCGTFGSFGHGHVRVGQSGKIDKTHFSLSPTACFSVVAMVRVGTPPRAAPTNGAFVTGLCVTILADLGTACSVVLCSKHVLCTQVLIAVVYRPRLIALLYSQTPI